MPWVIGGDLNENLTQEEKRRGQPRNQRQIDDFKEAVSFCGLQDFGGHPYTWSNNGEGTQNVQCSMQTRQISSKLIMDKYME